ncbi:MAG: FAD-dependent monooxygenase [Burkholderiales bacterium]|nr:FAD-dependent monooxygenase [Burkholderiales bacterium]
MGADSAGPQVAVVGTGVAGLAAALGLAQLGLRVALIGPSPRSSPPTPAFDARIYALSAGSVRLLEQLRVWAQVDAQRMQPVERMRVVGDTGRELDFSAYSVAAERLATIAEERELLRVLALGVQMAAGISRREAALTALQSSFDGVRLQLADGQALQVPLVIGADGAQSPVRAAAGIHAEVLPYGQTAVVANFACEQPHDGTAWQWFTDDGVIALLPLPGRAVSLVWSAPEALADSLQALAPVQLAERLTAYLGAVTQDAAGPLGRLQPLGTAAEPGRTHAFRLRRLRVDRLTVHGIALVGDAAHVVHPLAGQGLNLGLQDVSTLLEVLREREPWRALGDAVLLRRYARRRTEAIDLMRWTTDGLARLFAWDDPLVRQMRNTGLALVNAAGPLKRALVRHALG